MASTRLINRSSSAGFADNVKAMVNKLSSRSSRKSSSWVKNKVPSSPPIVNRFYESRKTQFNHQPKYPESKEKKALRITGYVATLGISYLIRKNKKKAKQSSVELLDSLSTASWEEDSIMPSTESLLESFRHSASSSNGQREQQHLVSLPMIIVHSPINDQVNQPSSTVAVALEVSNANTAATSTATFNATDVPVEVYDRLLTTLTDRIDRLTDEIPIDRIVDETISKMMSTHFTSDRNTEIDELNKMLLEKVNEISNLIDSHKAEIEERDGMLLDKVNEVSVLMDSHQAEINERDNTLLFKSNEITNLIDSHQIETAQLDRIVCEQRTEISYLKEELGLHDKEIVKCYRQISELEKEILILKKARLDNLSRESRDETIHHQSSQTDEEVPGQPFTVYVTKEWHEKEMKDYAQLVNDQHQHFVQAVQEQILSAEYSKEMELESSNILYQKMQSENLMLKVDLSVLNDIHEADMAERNRVISNLCKENETLRANLAAVEHASTSVQYSSSIKSRKAHSIYRQHQPNMGVKIRVAGGSRAPHANQ